MGVKNIQGELRVNNEVIATQDWVNQQIIEPAIIATFNITEDDISNDTNVVHLQNLSGMTEIDWGDGIINNELSHIYTLAKEYKCKIYDVINIGDYAFMDCYSLISAIISDQVMSIGEGVFWECRNLMKAVIGNSVTSIGTDAFYECRSLLEIVIPDSVTSIDGSAFSSSSVTNVIFKNPIPIDYVTPFFWFDHYPSLTHIYVPYGCKQTYIDKWTVDGATQDILDKIVESDREATMSDVDELREYVDNLPEATTSTSGLMSASDVNKLNECYNRGVFCSIANLTQLMNSISYLSHPRLIQLIVAKEVWTSEAQEAAALRDFLNAGGNLFSYVSQNSLKAFYTQAHNISYKNGVIHLTEYRLMINASDADLQVEKISFGNGINGFESSRDTFDLKNIGKYLSFKVYD